MKPFRSSGSEEEKTESVVVDEKDVASVDNVSMKEAEQLDPVGIVEFLRTVAQDPKSSYTSTESVKAEIIKYKKEAHKTVNGRLNGKKRSGSLSQLMVSKKFKLSNDEEEDSDQKKTLSPTIFKKTKIIFPSDNKAKSNKSAKTTTSTSSSTNDDPGAQMLENYVSTVSAFYFGEIDNTEDRSSSRANNKFNEKFRLTTLDMLISPLRTDSIIDRWTPKEVAIFEAGICKYGRQFHMIQRLIRTKTEREVIDFYYHWKKTSHYKMWKDNKKQVENENSYSWLL